MIFPIYLNAKVDSLNSCIHYSGVVQGCLEIIFVPTMSSIVSIIEMAKEYGGTPIPINYSINEPIEEGSYGISFTLKFQSSYKMMQFISINRS